MSKPIIKAVTATVTMNIEVICPLCEEKLNLLDIPDADYCGWYLGVIDKVWPHKSFINEHGWPDWNAINETIECYKCNGVFIVEDAKR